MSASEVQQIESLVAACIEAQELGEADPCPRLCAGSPHQQTRVQERLRQLAARGLIEGCAPPADIGPYRLVRRLGSGGMGEVWLAEQQEPVRRFVALKLIKLGMDSVAVMARFEQERQALALMDHEGIAKVFDCGTSERGQPYFVMELVQGIPIDRFCDQRQLGLPDRLQLLRQVCAAVQHAHQKGVVHRDLKPGNVLVSDDGGRLQVRIIDFGLAKAMGRKLVEATLVTEPGLVVGTPEYMAPEQADPTNPDIDTRADIYSLGVMLYQLLVGELPFAAHELRKAGMLELQRILREVDPPRPSTRLSSIGAAAVDVARSRRLPIAALAKALRSDLDWVVLKALEKDRDRRYESANALAADLQRFLDHEPLLAGPPSAGYRLRKFVRRRRGQVVAGAAVFLTAVAGAVVAIGYAVVAGDNAELSSRLAQEKGDLADTLAGKVREFDELAGVVLYERAIAAEADLHPAWPDRVEAMQQWLQDCRKLLLLLPGIEETLAGLRAHALPPTGPDVERDRQRHPRYGEWLALRQELPVLRRAQALRDGLAQAEAVPLPAAVQVQDARALNTLAWARVAPKPGERKVRGEVSYGLACAEAALAKLDAGDVSSPRHVVLDTLAWALFANGRDADARQRSEQAVAADAALQRHHADLLEAIAAAPTALAAAEQQFAALTGEVTQRWTYRLPIEQGARQFLHDALADLVAKIDRLRKNELASVEQRLSWAQRIGGLSRRHPNARAGWDEVRAAIARADDVVASRRYAGLAIELRDEDLVGLVPIGMNPVTKLWEFYELRSAWDGVQDPAAIAVPAHRPDGSIAVDGATGIVFVLLPGGTFTIGAQRDDPGAANYDEQAVTNERPHALLLAPFFLARYELTQAQWARLWTGDEGLRWPSWFRIGVTYRGIGTVKPQQPVEQVSWDMCELLLRRCAMEIPTEAQWEYGCRAGTDTAWYPGSDVADLQGHANVRDRDAVRAYAEWGAPEPFADGFAGTAPVGTYASNRFGLHDVHGNVWEWCRDWYGSYDAPVAPGDGLRLAGPASGNHVRRGSAYDVLARLGRSAARGMGAPSFRNGALGIRPARALQPATARPSAR